MKNERPAPLWLRLTAWCMLQCLAFLRWVSCCRWMLLVQRWTHSNPLQSIADYVVMNRVREWTLTRIHADPQLQANIPKHIAFIMDGNRRFAQRYGGIAFEGHLLGFQTLEQVLGFCLKLGLQTVTVYAFSIDNFRRTPQEVELLMSLFHDKLLALSQHSDLIKEYDVALRVVGDLDLLPTHVRQAALSAMEMTMHHKRSVLNICCPYTSHYEMTQALARSVVQSESKFNQSCLEENLFTTHCPPLDMLIRTSGETRLSDFLLWQCSDQCQLHFINVLWPEFTFWDLLPHLFLKM